MMRRAGVFIRDAYRLTLKRVRPLRTTFRKMGSLLIWTVERARRFRTMSSDPLWFRWELVTGAYERDTVDQILRLVKPGMSVLDLGAHVGFYSRLFSELVGHSGRVVAFEPHPEHFKLLVANTRRLGNVEAVNAAVSDCAGTAELHDFSIDSGSSSLRADPRKMERSLDELKRTHDVVRRGEGHQDVVYKITTIALDEYLKDDSQAYDLIKMDVEGAELEALIGMTKLIERSPNAMMITEFNPSALANLGTDPSELLAALAERFQYLYTIDDGVQPTSSADLASNVQQLTDFAVINLLCSRERL